jgi:putative SOS response-associated peptidase YedK
MCFTVNIHLTRQELEKRFGAKFREPTAYEASYYLNAFDLPMLPAIPSSHPDEIEMISWGLIPSWVKDAAAASEIRMKTFNARSETIREKPSFRSALKARRCLILVRGFYEWQHRDKERIPYFIHLRNEQPMALAGLFEDWTDRETGEQLRTCTIITTAASPMLEKIHNSKKRMPVILPKEAEKEWIDPGHSPDEAVSYLDPVPDALLMAYTISRLISKRGVEKNVPDLVKPFSYEEQGLW